MKWPFVRRSKYESMMYKLSCMNTKDVIENESLKKSIIEYNNETNRLNQELANELNSHRETKEALNAYKKALAERAEKHEKLLNEFRKTTAVFQEVKNEIIISLRKLY